MIEIDLAVVDVASGWGQGSSSGQAVPTTRAAMLPAASQTNSCATRPS
jgi:hypothetical protein